MKKEELVSTNPETRVENPVFSVIAGKEFRLDLSDNGGFYAVLVVGAAAACCICGGSDAAVRLGIGIVDRLLK